jgi:predicted  nucleic acid-binding Zn-ribbon protein
MLERELNAANERIKRLEEENGTPRTDAGLEYDDTTVDGVKEFARQLERELDRACKMYRKLDIHTLDLVDRIIRLEAAGDALAKTQTYDLLETVNWHKAKEAKL